MHAAPVVEQLGVIEYRRACRIAGCKITMVDQFVLQVAEEAFCHRSAIKGQLRNKN